MKNLTTLSFLFISSLAVASTSMTVADFQKLKFFDHVDVSNVEEVFYDEMSDEKVYQVTYMVEGECANTGNMDACEMVPYCEYFLVDNTTQDVEETLITCDKDIEEVIGEPTLWDEY